MFLLLEGSGMAATLNILFIGLMFAVVYFFMIRPQTQQREKQAAFIKAVAQGDRVVTVGGIHGKVVSANEDTVNIVVDAGKTILTVQRECISMEMSQNANAKAK